MKLLRLLGSAKRSFPRAFVLMRDSRVPFALKALTIALGALVISPVDVFGDIPILGVLDDAALLSLLCFAFIALASPHVEPKRVRSIAP
jgi:uncharacterized membrane protein YkvA (DUF1232 family)